VQAASSAKPLTASAGRQYDEIRGIGFSITKPKVPSAIGTSLNE
jgi:hypothetical protein